MSQDKPLRMIKPFARQGYFTAIDNVILDEIMPRLSGTEWKILCFIIRKTVGFQKETDAIAYSQIVKGTGIRSRNAVAQALRELQGLTKTSWPSGQTFWVRDSSKPDLIHAFEGEGRKDATSYRLNADVEIYIS
jgi:phage replication O-like protein O